MATIKRYDSDTRIFFTSDTHFGHTNILKYCSWRPGADTLDIEYMNNVLIEKWNSTIGADDIIYHLGDFAFLGTTKYIELLDKLNGEIHLIIGNHDELRYPKQKVLDKFKSVTHQRIIYIGNQAIYLNHFPFLCWGGMEHDPKVIQLHGHIHSHPDTISTELYGGIVREGMQYDVGVDNNDMKPISWLEIKQKLGL